MKPTRFKKWPSRGCGNYYGAYASHDNLTYKQYLYFEHIITSPSANIKSSNRLTYKSALNNQKIKIRKFIYSNKFTKSEEVTYIKKFIKLRLLAVVKYDSSQYIINPAFSLRLNYDQYKFAKDIIAKEFGR